VFGEVKPNVLPDRQRVEQRAGLKDHGHAVMVHDLGRVNRLAFDEDFPDVRFLQPNDVFEQDGFATAAGTHDNEYLTWLNVKVQPAEDFLTAKRLAQPAHLDADAMLIVGRTVHYFSRTRVRR
jgi:hypothetical protein